MKHMYPFVIATLLSVQFCAFAGTHNGYFVNEVYIANSNQINFISSFSTREYTVNLATWGSDSFDKVYTILTSALLSGNPVDYQFVDNTFEITSMTFTVNPNSIVEYCDRWTNNQNIMTILTGLTLTSSNWYGFTIGTTCGIGPLLISQPNTGVEKYNQLFAQQITALSKNVKVWIGCEANTVNVLYGTIHTFK